MAVERVNEFRVPARGGRRFIPRRLLSAAYIYIYFDTSVYDAQNSLATPAALMLSRVMSDLAPTGAYFLLRCLNIILTMFLWPRANGCVRDFARNLKFCGMISQVAASIRFSYTYVLGGKTRRTNFPFSRSVLSSVQYATNIFFHTLM